jgi:hypothetical protein
MAKKNRKVKTDEQMKAESDVLNAELTESASADAQRETSKSDATTDSASDVSSDDLLDEVRRSLIEEDADDEKKSPWWNKIGKGKQQPEHHEDVIPDTSKYVIEKPQEEDSYLDEIDELIDLLEPEAETVKIEAVAQPELVTPVEPEVPIDVDELKKRVFSSVETVKEQEISEVRAIALEGGEEVFVEVEAKAQDPLEESLKSFENSLRPYRKYIYYALALLGIVMAVAAGGLMFREYQKNLPPEPTPELSNLPFPSSIVLPGG